MRRPFIFGCVCWIILSAFSFLRAGEDLSSKDQGVEKKASEAKLDPIEKAFALPRGVKLQELNEKQKQAYQALKKKSTPKLKTLLEKIDHSPTENEKNVAARQMLDETKDIREKIEDILAAPAQEAAQKAAEQAQKKLAALKERQRAKEQAEKHRKKKHR